LVTLVYSAQLLLSAAAPVLASFKNWYCCKFSCRYTWRWKSCFFLLFCHCFACGLALNWLLIIQRKAAKRRGRSIDELRTEISAGRSFQWYMICCMDYAIAQPYFRVILTVWVSHTHVLLQSFRISNIYLSITVPFL